MSNVRSEWLELPFAKVAEYNVGRTPARANAWYWNQTGDVEPWVTISDMPPYGIVESTKESISAEAFGRVFGGCHVPTGTLIMSFKLTIGRVATLGLPAVHNEAIISIFPKPGIDQRYLGYYLSQVDYRQFQDRQIMGNTLNKSKIDRIPIPVLPEDEQRAIADVLDTIREAIAVQRRAEAAANELRRATAGKIFTRGLRGESVMESDLGPLPESWSVIDFAEVREWLQYGTSVHCTLETRPYPVLRIPNIESGRVNPTELKYADLPSDTAARYLLEPGDLIFIRTNGALDRLGACAVYQEEPVGALFASYLIRARLKPVVDPRYVAYFYGSPVGTALVAGSATPAADGKYNLNTGTIDSLPLLLPSSREEQEEIVAIFSAIEDKISLHRQKAATLEALFDHFLKFFMSGELRISDLDISMLHEKSVQPEAALV